MDYPTILICYSNPSGTTGLRLDKEHSVIDLAIREANVSTTSLRRLHATTLADMVNELVGGKYKVLQFSGHGNDAGILLENSDRSASELIDGETLSSILRMAKEHVLAVILTCCFSDSYRDQLANHVPYLITVDGPAPDAAAIQFSKCFYRQYLQTGSIESAFAFAELFTSRQSLKVNIHRRGLLSCDGELKIQATVERFCHIVLDLTAIRDTIDTLSVPKEQFLTAICTMLRAHFQQFASPAERVVLPFGQFLGLFSWNNQVDPIVCHRVLMVSKDISEDDFKQVMFIFFRYSGLARKRYRQQTEKEYSGKQGMLKSALDDFHATFEKYFSDNDSLRRLSPVAYKIANGIISACLAEGDATWAQEDFSHTILHLETALTAFHNLCLQLLDAIEDKTWNNVR